MIKQHVEQATIIRLNCFAYAYVSEDADPKEALAYAKQKHRKTIRNPRDLENYDNVFLWFIDKIDYYY